MYFEGLAVEIYATKGGLEAVKPPRMRGASGVEHRFSFLATQEGHSFGFELSPEVGEVEVLKAYAKQLDTGAKTYLVCLKGKPSQRGLELANEYRMRILSPGEIAQFFENKEWMEMTPPTMVEGSVVA